ncbi:MAG: hypothetical protein AAGC55_10535 [Myxococcota bacterium]
MSYRSRVVFIVVGAISAAAFACSGSSGGPDRPALDSSPEQDAETNGQEIDWTARSCGHPAIGDDEPDVIVDEGKAGWPDDVVEDPDGTLHTSFTVIRPVDSDGPEWDGHVDEGGMGHIAEFCARRENFFRAFEGLEPYGRYIAKEIVSIEDAQECLREGSDCKHRTTRAQPDSQNAIRGQDSGPTGSQWLAQQNFMLESWSQGYHYGAQTQTEPRLVACARYRENGAGITFQNHWDDAPPGRFTGIPDPEYFLPTAPASAGSLRAQSVAVGGRHTCALLTDGTVRCWGDGVWGQLGDDSFELPDDIPWAMWMHGRNLPGQAVNLDGPAVKLISGHDHSCALLDDGRAQCWGHDDSAQLGHYPHKGALNKFEEYKAFGPGDVADVYEEEDPVVDIAAAMQGTCITFQSGRVRCFGWAINGAMGREPFNGSNCWASFAAGNDGDYSDPQEGLTNIQLGSAHGCGMTSQGGVQCWGRDYRGQLGDGARETNFMASSEDCAGTLVDDTPELPRDVIGLRGGVKLVRAGAEHNCAIMDNGTVKCWGSNRLGQLGYRADYPVSEDAEEHERAPELEATPVEICLERPAIDLALGGAHSCALLDDGTVQCWGSANHGKLGNGHYVKHRIAPAPVAGLTDVVDIDSRHMHTCAVTSSGQLYCWGLNYNGQLGIGNAEDQATPQLVVGF